LVALGIGGASFLMFEWFKERRERIAEDRLKRDAPIILSRYQELLEKHPTAYMDETWLPVSKTQMKAILKAVWVSAKYDERRESIKIAWALLSKFQPGIGKVPISCTTPSYISYEEGLRILEPYMRIAKIAQAEDEANRTELLEFIQRNSKTILAARSSSDL
jgi:hypothetical protein